MTAEKVLQFWFGAPPLRPNRKLWWGGKSQDAAIHENFSETVAAAVAGHLDSWRDEPRGALALVILLDQMTRNIYRGQPEAFSGDGRALEVTLHGLQQGYLEVYHPFETVFFLMPLEHDESMVSQDRCIAELDQLLQRCGSEQADMDSSCSSGIRKKTVSKGW